MIGRETGELQNDSDRPGVELGKPQSLYGRVFDLKRMILRQDTGTQIDNQPVGAGHGKRMVGNGVAGLDKEPQFVRKGLVFQLN